MPETYDLILKGGIVVNQDGRVERDIGVRGGAIVRIGDLSQASTTRRIWSQAPARPPWAA